MDSNLKKEKIYFVGPFPPPVGGVTIKNCLIFNKLSAYYEIKRTTRHNLLSELLLLIKIFFSRNKVVVGVSSKNKKSQIITKFLFHFKKRTMKRSIYFMMGGVESKRIVCSKKEIAMYSTYKKIYVEIDSMKDELLKAGLSNVDIFPNCREKTIINHFPHDGFRVVFFSLISEMKGADIVVELARINRNISFYFYGPIESSYEKKFSFATESFKNIHYKGVFDASTSNVCNELAKYDVLLLPTKYKTEGIPGVLVEAKFSGIPSIVSNSSYNNKIINNGYDGFLVDGDDLDMYNQLLKNLYLDSLLLKQMKSNSLASSKNYDINEYIGTVLQDLND